MEWVLARVWTVWQKDIMEHIKALVEKMIGVVVFVVFVDKIVDIQRNDAFNKFK